MTFVGCFFTLFLALLCQQLLCSQGKSDEFNCRPIYVRWPRVRLSHQVMAAKNAALPLGECQTMCTDNRNPTRGGGSSQCSAFNHRSGVSSYANDCQTFSRENVQHTDGYMEADDRYTFYWKYCVDAVKSCDGEFAFTFFSDRHMLRSEVLQTKFTKSLEECLAMCLNDSQILCRSVSFNRTDGGCHISEHNQLSKPASVIVNNNPNYRIDYYENNCYNNSFSFSSFCEPSGIRVRVNSRIPYTGALYGLYDFFSCRIEPREEKQFEFLFPYPHLSRNCSDSMRQAGDDVVLEVVLSTDGVEPLYFITGDDLTYQARCPVKKLKSVTQNTEDASSRKGEYSKVPERKEERKGASIKEILDALMNSGTPEPSSRRFEEIAASRENNGNNGQTATATTAADIITSRAFTKDIFTLPLHGMQNANHQQNNEWTAVTAVGISAIEEHQESTTTPTTTTLLPTTSTPAGTTTTSAFTTADRTERGETTPAASMRPTTLVVRQQQNNNPMENAKSLDSTGRQNKVGMEAIFEEPDNNKNLPVPSSTTTTAATASTMFYSPTETHHEQLKMTTKRSTPMDAKDEWQNGRKEFSFSTHLAFPSNRILLHTGPGDGNAASSSGNVGGGTSPASSAADRRTSATSSETAATGATSTVAPSKAAEETTTTTPMTTTTTTTTTTSTSATTLLSSAHSSSTQASRPPGGNRVPSQGEKIIFEIFHNGQATEAVVVGSRITLAFTPYFAIPPSHMSISGCQVEPIGSLYEWEKEPLAIIKDGCQADHVGLVCPPQKTDYGIRVTVEAFRYQTTTQVQYTCLIRVCPFAPCPQITCPMVEGCPGDDIVSRSLGLNRRAKRNDQQLFGGGGLPLHESRLHALQSASHYPADGLLEQQQQDSPSWNGNQEMFRMDNALQQQLISIGGDSLVHRRLIVVNSDDELRYYAKTGEIPQIVPSV